jgi:hypothetical protein
MGFQVKSTERDGATNSSAAHHYLTPTHILSGRNPRKIKADRFGSAVPKARLSAPVALWQYNRHMDELERKVAKAAIEAPPAENPAQLAATIAHAINADAATVQSLLVSLCSRQILTRSSAHAGNLAAGERGSALVKLYYEKGPQWRTYLSHT